MAAAAAAADHDRNNGISNLKPNCGHFGRGLPNMGRRSKPTWQRLAMRTRTLKPNPNIHYWPYLSIGETDLDQDDAARSLSLSGMMNCFSLLCISTSNLHKEPISVSLITDFANYTATSSIMPCHAAPPPPPPPLLPLVDRLVVSCRLSLATEYSSFLCLLLPLQVGGFGK